MTIFVSVDGVLLGSVTMMFTPAPNLGHSNVTAEPSVLRADGVTASTLIVTVKDGAGNPMSGLDESDFAFIGVSYATIGGFDDTNAASGIYTFQVTNTVAEDVTITVIVDGIELGAVTIKFIADELDATLSSVVADPDVDIVADGIEFSVVTVTLRDRLGNLIPGLTPDEFSIDVGEFAQASAVTPVPGSPGVYRFTVTSTVSGTVTVKVTARGVTLDARPTIVFVAEWPTLEVTKSADRTSVTVGSLIAYRIDVRYEVIHDEPTPAFATKVIDRLPKGFAYVPGTSLVNGDPVDDPEIVGDMLMWEIGRIDPGEEVVVQYAVRVGLDAVSSDGVNRVHVSGLNLRGKSFLTDSVTARVVIESSLFGREGVVVGVVFRDDDGDGHRDTGEPGIPYATIYTDDGRRVVTDSEGRYSIRGLQAGIRALRIVVSTADGFWQESRFVQVPVGGIALLNVPVPVASEESGVAAGSGGRESMPLVGSGALGALPDRLIVGVLDVIVRSGEGGAVQHGAIFLHHRFDERSALTLRYTKAESSGAADTNDIVPTPVPLLDDGRTEMIPAATGTLYLHLETPLGNLTYGRYTPPFDRNNALFGRSRSLYGAVVESHAYDGALSILLYSGSPLDKVAKGGDDRLSGGRLAFGSSSGRLGLTFVEQRDDDAVRRYVGLDGWARIDDLAYVRLEAVAGSSVTQPEASGTAVALQSEVHISEALSLHLQWKQVIGKHVQVNGSVMPEGIEAKATALLQLSDDRQFTYERSFNDTPTGTRYGDAFRFEGTLSASVRYRIGYASEGPGLTLFDERSALAGAAFTWQGGEGLPLTVSAGVEVGSKTGWKLNVPLRATYRLQLGDGSNASLGFESYLGARLQGTSFTAAIEADGKGTVAYTKYELDADAQPRLTLGGQHTWDPPGPFSFSLAIEGRRGAEQVESTSIIWTIGFAPSEAFDLSLERKYVREETGDRQLLQATLEGDLEQFGLRYFLKATWHGPDGKPITDGRSLVDEVRVAFDRRSDDHRYVLLGQYLSRTYLLENPSGVGRTASRVTVGAIDAAYRFDSGTVLSARYGWKQELSAWKSALDALGVVRSDVAVAQLAVSWPLTERFAMELFGRALWDSIDGRTMGGAAELTYYITDIGLSVGYSTFGVDDPDLSSVAPWPEGVYYRLRVKF